MSIQRGSRATPGSKIFNHPCQVRCGKHICLCSAARREGSTEGQPEEDGKKRENEGEGEKASGADGEVNEEAE